MPDPLAAAEAEMADAEDLAYARLRTAVGWHQAADRELAALTGPVWGGAVDRWHEAHDAVIDAVSAVEAYERFPPLHLP